MHVVRCNTRQRQNWNEAIDKDYKIWTYYNIKYFHHSPVLEALRTISIDWFSTETLRLNFAVAFPKITKERFETGKLKCSRNQKDIYVVVSRKVMKWADVLSCMTSQYWNSSFHVCSIYYNIHKKFEAKFLTYGSCWVWRNSKHYSWLLTKK